MNLSVACNVTVLSLKIVISLHDHAVCPRWFIQAGTAFSILFWHRLRSPMLFHSLHNHRQGLSPRFAILLGMLLSLATPASAGPFNDFYGTWSGRGNAIFNGGAREALACKAYYTGQDSNLKLALRCASPSNKIDMRAALTDTGKVVTGTWEERTFNSQGSISGSVTNTQLKVKLAGGITGTLILSLGPDSQLVSLNTDGGTLSGVHLKLKRK